MLMRVIRDEKGEDIVEHGLLVSLISVAALVTVRAIGPVVSSSFGPVAEALRDGADKLLNHVCR